MKKPYYFKLICFCTLLLCSSSTQADWFSDLKKAAKDAFNELISSKDNTPKALVLHEVDPLLHTLPILMLITSRV